MLMIVARMGNDSNITFYTKPTPATLQGCAASCSQHSRHVHAQVED